MPTEISVVKELAPVVATVFIFVMYLYKREVEERIARADTLREHRETIERVVKEHEETVRAIVADSAKSHEEKTKAFLQSERDSKSLVERAFKNNHTRTQ